MKMRRTVISVLIMVLISMSACSGLYQLVGMEAEVELLDGELDLNYGIITLHTRAHNIGTETIGTLKVTYTAYLWDSAVGEYVSLDFWNTFTDLEPGTWQIALATDNYYLHIDVSDPDASLSYVVIKDINYQS